MGHRLAFPVDESPKCHVARHEMECCCTAELSTRPPQLDVSRAGGGLSQPAAVARLLAVPAIADLKNSSM